MPGNGAMDMGRSIGLPGTGIMCIMRGLIIMPAAGGLMAIGGKPGLNPCGEGPSRKQASEHQVQARRTSIFPNMPRRKKKERHIFPRLLLTNSQIGALRLALWQCLRYIGHGQPNAGRSSKCSCRGGRRPPHRRPAHSMQLTIVVVKYFGEHWEKNTILYALARVKS